ncbi:hypothetical protein M885DRAFT_612694 [Pelagophyceae sp. CCMP2097]|nr:hypothetical protein M885DRAFT_612694 [Pelagophyceae sp. CCMP2097]
MSAMDADYLKGTVGQPLKMALAALVVAQPADAIEYVGAYLLAHVAREETKAQQMDRFAYLDQAVAAKEASALEAAAAATAEAAASGPTDEEHALDAALAAELDIESLYPAVLKALQRAACATAAYAGKRGADASGASVVTFWCATEGCDMSGKFVSGPAPDADEAAEAGGVTLDLFKQREEYDAEVAAADEAVVAAHTALEDAAAATAEDGAGEDARAAEADATAAKSAAEALRAAVLRFPERVVVANVAREARVKFFGVPLLGSYVALPVRFESALHADGVGESKAGAAAEDADADDSSHAGAPAAAEPAVRLPLHLPAPRAVEYVLALHTMGKSAQIAASQLAACEAWATKLAAAHARADAAAWVASALLREDAASMDVPALNDLAAAADEAAAARAGEEGAAVDVCAAMAAVQVAKVYLPLLARVAADAIPPPAAAMAVLRAASALAGVWPAALVEAGTGAASWTKVRAALVSTLAPALDGGDFHDEGALAAAAASPATTAAATSAKALVEELDEAELSAFYAAPALLRLLAWTRAIVSLVEATQAKLEADKAAENEEA